MAWTVNNLKNDLKRLKNLYRMETNPTIKYELSRSIFSLELIITNFSHDRKESNIDVGNFFVCQDSLPNYMVEMPYIKDFITLTDDYVDDKTSISPTNSANYSKKEMYELTREFYRSVGGKFNKLFQEFDKEKANRINFTDRESIDSITYYISGLGKYYINLGCNSDDRDVIEAYIHEVGHVLAGKLNDRRYESNQIFVEIESIFFELLADRFLAKETNDKYFSDLEKVKFERYYTIGNFLDILDIAYNTTINHITEISDPNKVFLEVAINEGLIATIPFDIDSNMKYLFSYICAVELVEIYKEDKDKALFLLENILKDDKNISEYEKIVNNITPNKHVREYAKSLKLQK